LDEIHSMSILIYLYVYRNNMHSSVEHETLSREVIVVALEMRLRIS
jgi:hypothetical protein